MSSVLLYLNRLVHMEDCENLLIPRINKALESVAGFPSIPAPVNVSPAVEGQDHSYFRRISVFSMCLVLGFIAECQ